MSEEYLHGVRVNEITEGVRSIQTVSTAIIGLVATASDADEETFPLNKAVLLTNLQAYIAKAGKKGTLARALDGIADIVNCKVIVVRVPESTHDESTESEEYTAEMNANIIGITDENGNYTGMKALLTASVKYGIKPRILCVPKHDTKEVAVELAALAAKMNAFAYLSCYGCKTKEEVITYRKNFSQREVMLIFGDFISFNPITLQNEVDYAVVRAAAVRAYLDKEQGWHTSISNKAINGVSGVTKEIYFDINDSSTDVNFLNEKGITCCINYNGFRFWGLRTCSDEPKFKFEVYTRTAQVLKDTIAQSFDWAMAKDMSVTLVKDIIEGINAKWRDLTTKGMLMGGTAWITADLNSKENLSDGKLTIDYDYTPVPPLEQLGFNQRFTDSYLVNFVDSVNG